MKIGFNEANSKGCAGHTLMKDLEYCEKYGFDFIDIQSECLDRDLANGAVTLEQVGEFFRTHHLKMLSYNALVHFNMKETQEEKDAVMAELDEIIRRCGILGCSTIVVVPNEDIRVEATRGEIRKAIYDGMRTISEIRRYLRPGMGPCQGMTCERNVRGILARETGLPLSQIPGYRPRSPQRPVTLAELGNESEEEGGGV